MQRVEEGGDLYLLPSEFLSLLQFRAFNEPLLPNLKSLMLADVAENFVSFIPLLLPPRIVSIDLTFGSNFPEGVVASMFTTFPALCPNLQRIRLFSIPRDPMITTAVSEMLLVIDRSTLQKFDVTSPLTEEATEVICKLLRPREPLVIIGGPGSLPTLMLPSLVEIQVEYDHGHGWLQGFRGKTLGNLASIAFYPRSHLTTTSSRRLKALRSSHSSRRHSQSP